MWPGRDRYRKIIEEKDTDTNELDNDLLFLTSQIEHTREQGCSKPSDIRDTVLKLNPWWIDFQERLDSRSRSNENIANVFYLSDYQEESEFIQNRIDHDKKTVEKWELDLRKLSKRVKQFNKIIWCFHNLHDESVDSEISKKITLCFEQTRRMFFHKHPAFQKTYKLHKKYVQQKQNKVNEKELSRLEHKINSIQPEWDNLCSEIETKLFNSIHRYFSDMTLRKSKPAPNETKTSLENIQKRSLKYYDKLLQDLELMDAMPIEMKAITAHLVRQVAEYAKRQEVEESKGNTGDKEQLDLIRSLLEIHTDVTGLEPRAATHSGRENHSGPTSEYIRVIFNSLEIPITSSRSLNTKIGQAIEPVPIPKIIYED